MRDLLKLAAIAALGALWQTSAMAIPTNLALGGAASQSTTGYDGFASFGNDGNTSGTYGYSAGSVTHTADGDFTASWQVDLGGMFDISSINIWNRTDCCSSRLSNGRVSILDSALSELFFDTFSYTEFTLLDATHLRLIIPVAPLVNGQIVRVTNFGDYLHLAEVEVFGALPPVTGVPEPITLSLLGAGLAGIGAMRRKRG